MERLSVHLSFKFSERFESDIDLATIQTIIDKKNKGKSMFNKYEMMSKITGIGKGVIQYTSEFHQKYETMDEEEAKKLEKIAKRSEREYKKAKFMQKLRRRWK